MTVDYNKLPSFQWDLFIKYWNICLKNLTESQINKLSSLSSSSEQSTQQQTTISTEQQTTTTILFLAEAKKRQNRRNELARLDEAPSMFKNEQEEECWQTEQAMWTVDMIKQWIFGGRWVEVERTNFNALITLGVDNGISNDRDRSFRNRRRRYDDSDSGESEADADLGPPVGSLLISGAIIRTNVINKGILKHRWHEIDVIKNGLKNGVLKSLENVNLKDNDNLRIIETKHPGLQLFEDLVKKYHCEYSNCIRRKYSGAKLWKKK
eukprot:711915_1